MSSSVYIGAGRGKLTLDDGRMMTLNGLNNYATLSDGSEVYIGGEGYVSVPDASSVSIKLKPAAGASTSVGVTVSGAVQTVPTGTVKVLVNGVLYTQATLDENGQATLAVGTDAFTNGNGNYNITVVYGGDSNFAPSYSTAVFAFTAP